MQISNTKWKGNSNQATARDVGTEFVEFLQTGWSNKLTRSQRFLPVNHSICQRMIMILVSSLYIDHLLDIDVWTLCIVLISILIISYQMQHLEYLSLSFNLNLTRTMISNIF